MEGFLNFLKQLIRYQLHFNNPFFDPFLTDLLNYRIWEDLYNFKCLKIDGV